MDNVTPLFKKTYDSIGSPLTGSEFAQLLMDTGFLCHTMLNLEKIADSYSDKDPVIALALYDAIIKMTEAANAISEKARA